MDYDDMLDWEADNYEDLVESFISENQEAWDKHVDETFVGTMAAAADVDYDAMRDDQMEAGLLGDRK